MRNISAFLIGALFAIGLGVSGMTLPSKVIGFLDFFGSWDPSLVFVMGGAVVVYFIAFRIVRGIAPVLETSFSLPTNKIIDRKLLGGAALFGVGWGLAGYCPGPVLTSLGAGSTDAAIFFVAMMSGMLAHQFLISRRATEVAQAPPASASSDRACAEGQCGVALAR